MAPTNASKSFIFISYAHEDFTSANRIYRELQKAGLNPWLDKECLLPGQNWQNEIENAIKNSLYYIPLFSTVSVKKRGFIQKEFKFGLEILKEIPEEGIFVIPVRLDDCPIPYTKFQKYHYVDLFPNWNNGFQKILEAMGIKNKINSDTSNKVDREIDVLWKNLLKSLKEKKCIPFIGEDCLSLLNSFDYSKISHKWADEFGYPLNDTSDLASVSQFLALDNGNVMIPKNDLSDILSKIEPPDFSQDEYDNTPYSVLTKLKLPIYITTNYDHFMEAALISSGRQPVSDFCRWNEYLLKDDIYTDLTKNFGKVSFSFSETRLTSILEQNSDYKPTENRPLVYHLYGDMSIPESMVLTEKDYIDFVINLISTDRNNAIPAFVRQKIMATSLLFIGYRIENIFFRILLRNFLTKSLFSNILILSPTSPEKNSEVQKYMNQYAREMFNITALWNETHEFSAELRNRWKSFKNV